MTKSDIVDGVFERLGSYSKKETTAIVENILDIMKEALTRGDYVKVTGFGTFSVQSKKKRRGRNPQTGKAMPHLCTVWFRLLGTQQSRFPVSSS